jgi:hypothetical protein
MFWVFVEWVSQQLGWWWWVIAWNLLCHCIMPFLYMRKREVEKGMWRLLSGVSRSLKPERNQSKKFLVFRKHVGSCNCEGIDNYKVVLRHTNFGCRFCITCSVLDLTIVGGFGCHGSRFQCPGKYYKCLDFNICSSRPVAPMKITSDFA